jgi:hypothetical protein
MPLAGAVHHITVIEVVAARLRLLAQAVGVKRSEVVEV